MNFMNLVKTAAISGVLAIAATSASALTLDFDGTLIADNGILDLNPAVGAVSYSAGGISAGAVTSFDGGRMSLLNLTVNTTAASAADALISASDTGYGAGSGLPTWVSTSLNASLMSSTSGTPKVTGAGYVDDADGLFSMATLVGVGSITDTVTPLSGGSATNLSNPFSMSIFTTIHAGTFTSYDATLIASPVPVPAGILLMGTALAGFGVMRRRKKAA